jgi:hypothetical protein
MTDHLRPNLFAFIADLWGRCKGILHFVRAVLSQGFL